MIKPLPAIDLEPLRRIASDLRLDSFGPNSTRLRYVREMVRDADSDVQAFAYSNRVFFVAVSGHRGWEWASTLATAQGGTVEHVARCLQLRVKPRVRMHYPVHVVVNGGVASVDTDGDLVLSEVCCVGSQLQTVTAFARWMADTVTTLADRLRELVENNAKEVNQYNEGLRSMGRGDAVTPANMRVYRMIFAEYQDRVSCYPTNSKKFKEANNKLLKWINSDEACHLRIEHDGAMYRGVHGADQFTEDCLTHIKGAIRRRNKKNKGMR